MKKNQSSFWEKKKAELIWLYLVEVGNFREKRMFQKRLNLVLLIEVY